MAMMYEISNTLIIEKCILSKYKDLKFMLWWRVHMWNMSISELNELSYNNLCILFIHEPLLNFRIEWMVLKWRGKVVKKLLRAIKLRARIINMDPMWLSKYFQWIYGWSNEFIDVYHIRTYDFAYWFSIFIFTCMEISL